ncbi:MAG: Hpt domain-containing protein, partial [Bacteroidota bacterium]
ADPLFLKEVIDVFLQSLPQFLTEVDLALQQSQPQKLRSIVHKFKSSTRHLGALQLSELCLQTERMIKEGSFTPHLLADKVTDICRQSRALEEELQVLRQELVC